MKTLALLVLLTMGFGLQAQDNIYAFTVKDISGQVFKLESLKGKKVLIVNTASKCGLTPQYKDLEKLFQEYKDQNFVIIGFPANNFAKQEPGTDEEIADFCEKNYGVSFPMMSKISVKDEGIDPLYSWLSLKEKNGVMDAAVKWNFQKFLINEQGELVDMVLPREKPYNKTIINWLEN